MKVVVDLGPYATSTGCAWRRRLKCSRLATLAHSAP